MSRINELRPRFICPIQGGAGNDTLVAGPGANLLLGGAGDDWLIAFADKFPDTLDGGTGFDRELLAGTSDDVLIDIERPLPAGQSRLVVELLGQ